MPASTNYRATASAPSNIAIVKYWGKQGVQEPVNPSISFTLSKALTHTTIDYRPGPEALTIEFLFEGWPKDSFLPKLNALTRRLVQHLPYLEKGHLRIESSNTFPHSSGIASSASSMASIAKVLVEIQQQLSATKDSEINHEQISELARLGSGSACRSTLPGWVLWGETEALASSSNRFGVSINEVIHPTFKDLQDTILVIRKGAKSVSSTTGHQLMENHPYREGRIDQANRNIKKLLNSLKEGNFNTFAEVCEEEALSLHGLMMSSSPGYTLMAPESLRAIRRIQKFREHHHVPLTYTLDAGPNIHLIYPKAQRKILEPFIREHLQPLCDNQEVINDELSID